MMDNRIIVDRYISSCGEMRLGDYQGRLCLCDWTVAPHRATVERRIMQRLGVEMEEGRTDLTMRASLQLEEYFSLQRKSFDLPLLFCGTFFQCEVWRYLLTIPYGTTMSYSELAQSVRKPKSVRAVANAVGANALAVVVPCHRVVPKAGSLGEYSGGNQLKRQLLILENEDLAFI